MWRRRPDGICTCNGLHYRRGTLSLGNTNILRWIVNILVLCSLGDFIFIVSDSKHVHTLLWTEDTTSSKTVRYRNILEKTRSKGQSVSHSSVVEKGIFPWKTLSIKTESRNQRLVGQRPISCKL